MAFQIYLINLSQREKLNVTMAAEVGSKVEVLRILGAKGYRYFDKTNNKQRT